MRVALWWKLNWSWFCIIECSYKEATRPIEDWEIEPFPDKEAMQSFSESDIEIEPPSNIKIENITGILQTPCATDQEVGAEPMEDVIPQHPAGTLPEIQKYLRRFWEMTKRLNAKSQWPTHLGENQWLEIGDILITLGDELIKFGLIDMDLGLLENEIMHRNSTSWM
jgi:hypothetical protein